MKIFRITQYMVPTMMTGLVLIGLLAYAWFSAPSELPEEVTNEAETMDVRPNAPGSPAAMLEKHDATCWVEKQKGPTTGAIIRIKPNGPVIRTHKRHLVDRALRQVIDKTDEGLDGVFAFCTNHPK